MTRRAAVTPLTRYQDGRPRPDQDLVAIEAPLRIDVRSAADRRADTLGVFMRTPGDDEDLVRGMLFGEGIIASAADIEGVAASEATPDTATPVLTVTLAAHVAPDLAGARRRVLAASACGICGRTDGVTFAALPGVSAPPDRPRIRPATVAELPGQLRRRQTVFAETGGLHAAGFFEADGTYVASAEDVGRHNAVDKLVGRALLRGGLPACRWILVVSGRVAFEIVQKAVAAQAAALVAVGAPSSLAVEAARAVGLTLVGFARDGRFNVYAGGERIHAGDAAWERAQSS